MATGEYVTGVSTFSWCHEFIILAQWNTALSGALITSNDAPLYQNELSVNEIILFTVGKQKSPHTLAWTIVVC